MGSARRFIQAAVMAAVLPVLGGCAINTAISHTLPCNVGPILTHSGDHISDATGRQIIVLNRTGATFCGWAPRKATK